MSDRYQIKLVKHCLVQAIPARVLTECSPCELADDLCKFYKENISYKINCLKYKFKFTKIRYKITINTANFIEDE